MAIYTMMKIPAERGGSMQEQNKIRPVAYGLALYLLMGVFDALNISGVGSFLKIAAFIPLGMMFFQLKELRLRFHTLFCMQIGFWLLALVSMFYTVSVDRTFSASMTMTLNLVLVLMLMLCLFRQRLRILPFATPIVDVSSISFARYTLPPVVAAVCSSACDVMATNSVETKASWSPTLACVAPQMQWE